MEIEKNFEYKKIVLPDGSFGLIFHFFWDFFSVASFEKVDTEPTREILMAHGMRRWLVLWSPWKRTKIPLHWRCFGGWFSRNYHHSTRSAFTLLKEDYRKQWSHGHRSDMHKIYPLIEDGTLRIETKGDPEDFLALYFRTEVPYPHKDFFLKRQQFFYAHHPKNFRTYIAYIKNEPMAGAVFLDDYPTSTYLIAFQDIKARQYHLWLAIIDTWFQESLKKKFLYLDFDHMRDHKDPVSYQGYTDFKSGIADYELHFEEVWLRFFWD
jgi:Acetyltransferase (GNAT) domain